LRQSNNQSKNQVFAYSSVSSCRISGQSDLVPILDLGMQALTGIFPRNLDDEVPVAPLELVWSPSSGLVQLRHSFPLDDWAAAGFSDSGIG